MARPRPPMGGGYANPVRGASVTFGRVDQGVDYWGSGPIHALGPGVIEDVHNAGWPGGTFIVERLTGGPDAGSYWYSAENIGPRVSIGEHVTSATVIGDLQGGMETGWAAPPPMLGESLAHLHGHTAFPTPEGTMAERLLHGLGAPGPGEHSGPSGPGGGGGGGGGGVVLTSSGPGGLSSILSGTGSLFHGAAEALDWLFGFWYPGQGWRIVFGGVAVASGWAAIGSWRSAAEGEQPGGSLPLAVGLAGVTALAAFMALRPWPMVGTAPVKPGAYIVETLEGAPPVAGQPRPKDVTGIEIGLGVLAGAWLASKLASAGSSVLGFLGGLGAALGLGRGGGVPEVPPVVE